MKTIQILDTYLIKFRRFVWICILNVKYEYSL